MAKQKIIVCATAYYPFIGGAEIAVQEVAKRLSSRFDFVILTSRMNRRLPRRENRPEGTVIRLGFGTRMDKWFLPWTTLCYLSLNAGPRTSPALLWGMDISQGAFSAIVAKIFFPRIPFVSTVQYGEREERLRHGRLGLIAKAFRAMLRNADYLTAISKYLLDVSRSYGYCGPASVIHNGVDIEKFGVQSAVLNAQRQKTIITVSRLVSKNGVDILIGAIVEVKKSIPDVRCLIIGDGPERRTLEKMVDQLGLRPNIVFCGSVANEQLPQLLHGADVFVRASRSEGMGNAFVEALAAGVPIIGTAVGGIPDIIEDGVTGLFARINDPQDLAEKILQVLENVGLAGVLARAGRAKVERSFSWSAIADQYATIFRQTLEVERRVVIATGLFPPEIGGPATYAKFLVDELPKSGIGLRVVVFASVHHLPKFIRHVIYFWRVVWASRGSDTIFAQDPVSVGLPACVASLLMRKRFYLKIVGDYAWEQGVARFGVHETLDEFPARHYAGPVELLRWIERLVAHSAKRVIVPSEYLGRVVKKWGVAPDRIEVIHNAFSLPRVLVGRDEARHGLGIAQGTFAIVSVGRLVPWKGFDSLIMAMPLIRERAPSAKLYIVGSGPENEKLAALIQKTGLIDVTTLTGEVSHEQALLYMRAGDLFILNSSYEGFSHTLLEAMAMEIPVMAIDTGGNSEIVVDGTNGILYKNSDLESITKAFFSLYENPDLRRRFAESGKIYVSRFSKEEMIKKTAAALSL